MHHNQIKIITITVTLQNTKEKDILLTYQPKRSDLQANVERRCDILSNRDLEYCNNCAYCIYDEDEHRYCCELEKRQFNKNNGYCEEYCREA